MKITRSRKEGDTRISFEDDMTVEEEVEWEDNNIPRFLTPRQLRLALIEYGISISQIDAAIDLIENQTQKERVKVMREYSLEFDRKSEDLISFSQTLGISEDKIKEIFILGSTI